MRLVWTTRHIDAPAPQLWELLIDSDAWPLWGPSIRSARTDSSAPIGLASTGTLETVVGVRLRFEITAFDAGSSWTWAVAGVPATSHRVHAVNPTSAEVGFGVPWVALPYLAVCRVALRRIEALATASG